MDEPPHRSSEPQPHEVRLRLDARTPTERLDCALTRIERVLRDFEDRLAWK